MVLGNTGLMAQEGIDVTAVETARKTLAESRCAAIMLTGNDKPTAEHVASLLGIATVIAEVPLEDKSARIAELQQAAKTVAMVADDVNALLLARLRLPDQAAPRRRAVPNRGLPRRCPVGPDQMKTLTR